MLDNTMATTMPMEILADAKVLKNKQQQQQQSQQNSEDKLQNTTLTKTNKTKTILNWLKNTATNTKSNCNNNLTGDNTDISSCHHNRFDKVIRQPGKQRQQQQQEEVATTQQQQKLAATQTLACNECTCPTVKQQNSTRSNKSSSSSSLLINNNNNNNSNNSNNRDDDTLREFRGVQTLKHLWNKRITANKESALRAKDCKHHHNKQFTKSVSCLLNTIHNTGEPPPLSAEEHLKARKLRALSLHDCSILSRTDSLTFDEISLSDIEIQKHLEKDNFYKYKTAEQASKLRELSEHSTARRLSNGIVVPKPERLNWLKRHEKFNKKKSIDVITVTTPSHSANVMSRDLINGKVFNDFDNVAELNISATIYDDIIINEHMNIMNSTRNSLTLPTANSQNQNEVGSTTTSTTAANNGSESSTPTLTATNSPLRVISRRSSTTRKDSSKSLASASSISRDSSAGSLTLSSGQKSHVKRNSSTRKYSFKTHSRSYHAPRKMHTNKENVVTTTKTGQTAPCPANSLVAKLTQQFNEIIQKDKTLLDEIKRKNGVIMTHKGHVYKVVDTKNQTPSISRSSSKSQDINCAEKIKTHSSTVQQNIQKFERESRGLKPNVPIKSKIVLKKSNEQRAIKILATENRLNVNNSKQKVENETKLEVKPNSLNITPTLEMVQEEAKTPVDNKELVRKQSEKTTRDIHNSQENIHSQIDPTKSIEDERDIPPKIQNTTSQTQTDNVTRIDESMILEKSTNNSPARSIKEFETDLEKQNLSDALITTTDSMTYSLADTCDSKQSTDKEGVSQEDRNQHVTLDKENKENKITVETNNQKSQLNLSTTNKQGELKFKLYEHLNNLPQCLVTEDFDKASKETNVLPPLSPEIPSKEKIKNEISPSQDTSFSKENQESPEHNEDDDKRKRKHKYAQIYEKLRFVNLFSHSNKKQKLTPHTMSPDTNKSKDSTQEKQSLDILRPLENSQYTPMKTPSPVLRRHMEEEDYSLMFNPEAKLLDALEKVDQKIQNLNHSNESDLHLDSDEYGLPLKPNSSFLHQSQAKDIALKPATIIQAVNVTLVNAIEGEQMIMEQKEIQEEKIRYENENEPKISILADDDDEPIYEPICTINIDEVTTEISKTPTGVKYQTCEFSSTIDICGSQAHIVEEDIYQTVDEVKMEESLKLKLPEVIMNAKPELDGYEPIENCVDNTSTPLLPLKCNISVSPKIIHFDGYEECTPPADHTPTTLGVRKVTDQLPELPQPKRILQKSPVPSRTAPKPPLPMKHHQVEEDVESVTSTMPESNYDLDGNENIYDTIKGIHCYESLQSYNNKLQNCPSATIIADCVSLSSNCYESIPHYKRTNTIGHHHHHHHHSGGSSNGSTVTISSDQKTNSLYDGSLTFNIQQYSSKRIYRTNINETHIGISKSIDAQSVNGGYAGSIGRTSDTSDEWTDVTDNENGDEDSGKPQFIIVRERSKVHKSPDWSKRVYRQRKSKSCIEDDDPDHYYEQLSPQGLAKRSPSHHQNYTNSLHRNQDMVRISKRNKYITGSAQALGQHISDDSFDSDTDYYESEHLKNSHNDSGVDVGNRSILPEPPSSASSSNQMYSFVKMFKNFIVNKKSPNSSKHGGSQQKIYDNSSQFYVSGQYEGKQSSMLQVPVTKELSTSEKNLIMAQSAVSKPEPVNTSTTPRKPKSGKSFRSRLRKSLVGFDNKQLSVLTPTRSTFYIEDPAHDDSNGQLDSGFSEKALSGDLPTTASTLPHSPESPKFSTLARKSKKDTKLVNTHRRRTIVGIRPNDPPPPPPSETASQTKRLSNTSWYAECGVFKNGTTNLLHDDSQILNSRTGGSGSSFAAGSTWYEEAGLYQTSGVSVASSSGSSGVSTSNEAGTADEVSHSMFSNEPLYQIYSAAKLEAISRDMQDESSTDGYEEIGDRNKNGTAAEGKRKSSRPSALQLIEPKSGPERTLWCQIPEVIHSCIIPTMTPRERALMEAKFEVITSEASYLKSLNLLRTHYMNHPIFRDQNIVSSRDRKFLFAHIVPVHECSEKLLTELESCWQDNIMLVGLSKRIYAIAEKHFHVYIGFCEHQNRMDRTLKLLREGKGLFSQNLELLESSPSCCGLNLHSFLMLPMQRITRLPLLIDAVFSKCHPNDDEYENWKMCLAIMNKIVTHCNEAANKSEQAFEIERISRQLEFNASSIRPLAIAPAGVLAPGTKPRFLVKKGELTHLIWRGDDAKLTFGKKFSKTTIFAFLFSDLLVLTKRKADEHFSVFDYCPRNMLTITSGDTLPQLPTKDFNSQTSKNLILMTLLENHERKTVELLLSCPSVSEQERWLQAMRPPESETPGEKLYEQWDCPQVMAKHLYENNEPDVLNLEVGDVVNVTRKLPDGWYKGERIRDGAVGWFPGSFTEEVNSVHVRARNLKQRHRLLTFTATYLESQKRNK